MKLGIVIHTYAPSAVMSAQLTASRVSLRAPLCAFRAASRQRPSAPQLRRGAPRCAATLAAAAAPLGYDSNFGPASSLDNTVHGACRPGGAGADDVPVPDGSISDAAVAAWAAHVAAAGVTRVVSLLDASELKAYATPLSEQYGRLFNRHDMVQMSHDPAESRAAHARIMAAFSDAHAAGERVVVHCRGGQSRTGLALASWLVQQHGCSAEAAAAEVERNAAAQKLIRFAKAAKVSAFTGRA